MTLSRKNQHYYAVRLALSGVWKENIYTYMSATEVKKGQIVLCPFGSKQQLGIVMSEVTKPSFKTKSILSASKFVLSASTLDFHDWLHSYYPGVSGQTTQHFLPSFLKKPIRLDASGDNPKDRKAKSLQALTASQKEALGKIQSSDSSAVVLHGITGSGKTRVYMELASEQLNAGKDVLLLYPEISLTSQLKKTLTTYFGESSVRVYHSKRTPKEQRETWQHSYNSDENKPKIYIGPRSALFLPHSNLGLVIVDESHDGSYKQDSGSRYHGLLAAAALASTHKAKIIFGSATPPVAETQQILSRGGTLVCMHETAMKTERSDTTFLTVDMTDKKNGAAESYLLSKQLLSHIKLSLQNNKQILLFLNRRGTARLLLCENCGWHAECPDCEMPLTYHHDNHEVRCHVCGYKHSSPHACPDCQHTLTQKTAGIKSVEEELKQLFPSARLARFDSDNNKADSFSERFSDVVDGKVDIILGTQLITKGLDLPLLETVGVLQADSALFLPDYTSEERSFQQLTQVAGRVGRGHSADKSTVLFQTYSPESHIISYATKQNWHGFYEQELLARKNSHYPPYTYTAKIWVQKKSQKTAENAIKLIARNLQLGSGLSVLGPAPSFYEKSAGLYAWQIVVKTSNRKNVTDIISTLPKETFIDLDPVSLL